MSVTVGIMTMHRIHNYGSSLQAYGLKRLIETQVADADVGFVDFRPGPVLVGSGRSGDSTSRVARTAQKVRSYGQVDAGLADRVRFLNHKRTYGKRYFPLIDLPRQRNYDLRLDVQVIGSDEVFNCVQSNSNVGYARDLFGHDSQAGRLISYAASFGNTTIGKIESAGIRRELVADLDRFEALSVRDANSAQIVEELTGREPSIHVDPVLAHDFMTSEARIPQGRQFAGKYLIVYGYSGRLSQRENDALAAFARRNGLAVLCFGGVQGCCDKFIDCDPFELLAYFRDAEAVVTDTFHGTIMAMINRKPFASVIRRSEGHGYGNEEKLGFLLDTVGLAAQGVSDVAQVDDVLTQPLDYDAVDTVLDEARERTRSYLRAQIT